MAALQRVSLVIDSGLIQVRYTKELAFVGRHSFELSLLPEMLQALRKNT